MLKRFMVLAIVLVLATVNSAWAQTARPGQLLRVAAERTNLRDRGSIDGAVVASLTKGDELEVIDVAGTWYQVKVKATGKAGYVSALVVENVAAVAEPTPSQPTPGGATPPPLVSRRAPTRVPPPVATVRVRDLAVQANGGWMTGSFESGGDFSGFQVGGGLQLHPFENKKVGVGVDFAYGKAPIATFSVNGRQVEGEEVSFLEGDLLGYYRLDQDDWKVIPFAGAGFQIGNWKYLHSYYNNNGQTDSRYYSLVVGGGFEFPFGDGHALRVEGRLGQFFSLTGAFVF